MSSQPPERSSSYLCLPIVPSRRRLCCLHTVVFPPSPCSCVSVSLSLPVVATKRVRTEASRGTLSVEEEEGERRRTVSKRSLLLVRLPPFTSPASPPRLARSFSLPFSAVCPCVSSFFPFSLLSLSLSPPSFLSVSVSVSLLSFSRGQRTGARRDRNHTHARCEPARL